MYEYPPILSGDAITQIAALRDYLVRQTRNREHEIAESEGGGVRVIRTKGENSKNGVQKAGAKEWQEAAALRALIIKTANVIEQHVDELIEGLHEDYLAISDFGTYRENIDLQIRTTARGIVEDYGYDELIQAAEGEIEGLQEAMTALDGQIRRGIMTDPETSETVLGIAISQNLRFTGNTQTQDGKTYFELSPGQTLGMYTSTGWQFWINGSKRGWFDSQDGMLHVSKIMVESRLQLGTEWLITTSGGFGIRKIG